MALAQSASAPNLEDKTRGSHTSGSADGSYIMEDDVGEEDLLPDVRDAGARAASSRGSGSKQEDPMTRSMPNLRKGTSTPAPGQYIWRDEVNLRKKPVWTMQSPDRKSLDLMLGTWTPACSSVQPRAPDPGEYGAQDTCGYHGVFTSPKWSQARSSGRPCLAPNPPEKIELELNLPPAVGGHEPHKRKLPHWSVVGKDRSQLPADLPTWTPKPNTDIRPGPGTYKLSSFAWSPKPKSDGRKPPDYQRQSRWKATTRSGCTWGRKLQNLHPDERAFVTRTTGATIKAGEWSRYRG